MSPGSLQAEIKKKRPFESLEQEALLNVLRTGDRLQIQLDRLLRSFGITSSQYNVLRILRGEGVALPCAEIGSRMIATVPALTGLVDRLEQARLIRRQRSARDRRVIYVAITDKALSLLAKIDRPLADFHQRLLGHLAPAELTELSHLLEKVRHHDERAESLSLSV